MVKVVKNERISRVLNMKVIYNINLKVPTIGKKRRRDSRGGEEGGGNKRKKNAIFFVRI